MKAWRAATVVVFAATCTALVFPWPFLYAHGLDLPVALRVLWSALFLNLASGVLLVVGEERRGWSVGVWMLLLLLAGTIQVGLYGMATLE